MPRIARSRCGSGRRAVLPPPRSRSVHRLAPRSSRRSALGPRSSAFLHAQHDRALVGTTRDRKSTRLNSSHSQISYAVFCLKKKKMKFVTLYNNKTDVGDSYNYLV